MSPTNVASRDGMPGGTRKRHPLRISGCSRAVKKNAEYNGLDPEKLVIVHASANRGRGQKAFFPRAMGRATPKVRETVNIEIIVQEVE